MPPSPSCQSGAHAQDSPYSMLLLCWGTSNIPPPSLKVLNIQYMHVIHDCEMIRSPLMGIPPRATLKLHVPHTVDLSRSYAALPLTWHGTRFTAMPKWLDKSHVISVPVYGSGLPKMTCRSLVQRTIRSSTGLPYCTEHSSTTQGGRQQ